MLPKCQTCGKAFFYPRVRCPFCSSGTSPGSRRVPRHPLLVRDRHQILTKAFRKPPVILAMSSWRKALGS